LGWSDSHLHAFRFGSGFKQIEFVSHFTLAEGGIEALDEDSVTLREVIHKKGQVFAYEYDFGDSWQHQIKVEKILEPTMELPVCLSGSRACPPEDCGGVPGYLRAIHLLQNPNEDEDQELRE